jgi:hypothetical protein|nr:MAG TPA: hypothetical protein [Caudoviricetes sp.]
MESVITPHTSLISEVILQLKELRDSFSLSSEYYIEQVNKRIDLLDLICKNANDQLTTKYAHELK